MCSRDLVSPCFLFAVPVCGMFSGIEYVIAPVVLGDRGAAPRAVSGRRQDKTIPLSQHLVRLEGRELSELPKVCARHSVRGC